jgi:hypothetical protein
LLVTTNYSAYLNVAKSYVFAEEMKKDNDMIINSVKTSYIQENTKKDNSN